MTTTDHRTTATPAIRLAGVTKTFGDVTAVDGLDLAVDAGEVVALLGPNGAGKTTTIDLVLGLARPTAGTVEVHGGAPSEAVRLGRVSAVMQTGGLLKDYTIAETVRFTASLYRPARPVQEVLERAGLTGIADRRVAACSGGEQQRLRFALALLPDPDLLILDEPTTGMDVAGRRDFWHAMREDAGRGRTVVFATHYLEEADAYADRIVLVRHGRVVADGSAAQIKAMSSGRTLRATLPGADAEELGHIEGVTSVEVRGDSVLLHARSTDEAARWLLNRTGAHDLEISSHNLEDAFVALTSDDAVDPEPTASTPAREGALA